jgi:hypothetical protein
MYRLEMKQIQDSLKTDPELYFIDAAMLPQP